MKRTQLKDALRNIWKQKMSYFSIVVIALLAVTAYVGIDLGAEAVRRGGSSFYRETNFRDEEIVSTLLLTEDDMEAIRAVDGVADVEGVYQTAGSVTRGALHESVGVLSLTERINIPRLVSGRLPEATGECAVEQAVMESLGLSLDDSIEITDSRGETAAYLRTGSYVITGVVLHPDHLAWPDIVPGDRYVLVRAEDFDLDALDGCCMKAELTLEKPEGIGYYDAKYLVSLSDTEARLSALADERASMRSDEVHDIYQAELDDGQAELDDAGERLDDARAGLDDGWAALADGERESADGKQELDDAKAQLGEAEAQLTDGKAQLDDGQAKLDASHAQLQAAENELNTNEARLREAEQQLADGRKELDSARERLDEGKRLLDAGEAELIQAETELSAGREELASGYEQLEDAKSTIRNALYSALSGVVGEYADRLSWGESAHGVDVDSYAAAAALLPITDGITIDLDRSMSDNIFSLISSLGIPEEELKAAFEAATGIYLELTDGSSLLDAVVSYAAERYAQYDSQYEALASAARSWDAGHEEYLDGLAQYEAGLAEFTEKSAEYYDGLAEYTAGLAQYEEGVAEYNAGRAALDEAWARYRSGLEQYEAGQATLSESRRAYQDGVAEYEAGLEAYNDGVAAYEDGVAALESGRTELEDGEAAYADGLAEYEDGVRQLDEARERLEELDDCRWVVLNALGNGGYVHLKLAVQSISKIGATFSMIFVLVGALVIYATVGRIVDEQRKLVGTTKALGFFNREIFAKYLSFGVSGTLLGVVLGFCSAYFIFQKLITASLASRYVIGNAPLVFKPGLAALAVMLGAALAAAAIWIACSQLMRSTAIVLMQEKLPGGKKKEAKGNRAGSLYTRLILLNMRSDLKRVAVTIVSVAGCCMLLVIGFTLRSAIAGGVDKQFREIFVYDDKLTFDPGAAENTEAELEAILNDAGVEWTEVHDAYYSIQGTESLEAAQLLVADPARLGDFIVLRDWKNGQALDLPQGGLLVQKRYAETSGLGVGDEIVVYDGAMTPHDARIAGVFDNYLAQATTVIMSEDYYTGLFGMEAEKNTYYITLNGEEDMLAERLAAVEGFASFTSSDAAAERFRGYVGTLNMMIGALIFMAGLMAYFILANLSNMYINQKKRELTIMRVNGFTVREVKNYVSRETIVTTGVGLLLGVAGGAVMAYRIVRLVEASFQQFDRSVNWGGLLLSAAITAGFALVINAWALRKVRTLRLTDVA